MAEAQQLPLHVMADEANGWRGEKGSGGKNMMRWFRIALYTMFLLCGQTAAVLLSRLYYEKGGKSIWVATLVQVVGFPVLFPCYYCIPKTKVLTMQNTSGLKKEPPSSLLLLVIVYACLGLLAAGTALLFSFGFRYLPVSTLTLISASQLAFNAFFSYFLNSQKFTPFIVNSLVLLTISSVLLVANDNSEKPPGVSKGQYAAGFLCTVLGAASYGLLYACQQLAFRKVLKTQTLKAAMDLTIYQCLAASVAASVGFFAAGDWKGMTREIEGYKLGKVSYAMVLLWTAIVYQIFTFGAVAMIFEVSALFSNSISAFGLPIVPIIAMVVFHDKMSFIKGIAMVLAIWGFISYAYQHYYLDEKLGTEHRNEEGQVS